MWSNTIPRTSHAVTNDYEKQGVRLLRTHSLALSSSITKQISSAGCASIMSRRHPMSSTPTPEITSGIGYEIQVEVIWLEYSRGDQKGRKEVGGQRGNCFFYQSVRPLLFPIYLSLSRRRGTLLGDFLCVVFPSSLGHRPYPQYGWDFPEEILKNSRQTPETLSEPFLDSLELSSRARLEIPETQQFKAFRPEHLGTLPPEQDNRPPPPAPSQPPSLRVGHPSPPP